MHVLAPEFDQVFAAQTTGVDVPAGQEVPAGQTPSPVPATFTLVEQYEPALQG